MESVWFVIAGFLRWLWIKREIRVKRTPLTSMRMIAKRIAMMRTTLMSMRITNGKRQSACLASAMKSMFTWIRRSHLRVGLMQHGDSAVRTGDHDDQKPSDHPCQKEDRLSFAINSSKMSPYQPKIPRGERCERDRLNPPGRCHKKTSSYTADRRTRSAPKDDNARS